MEVNIVSRYREVDSIIHRIDPITKLIAFLITTVAMFVAQTPDTLIVVFAFMNIIALFAKVRLRRTFFSLLAVLVPFYIMMFLLYLIPYSVKDSAILVAMMTIRFYMFILWSIVFTSTTKEMEISGAIQWLITPLRLIKVPTYEISMMIMLAIRFIPLLFADLIKIMIAQTSRGINVINGNLKTKIKGITNSLLPMFILSFKRSDDVANAMIIRGYKIGEKRSKFRKNKFGFLEAATLLICLSLLVVVILRIVGIIMWVWF